MTMIKRIAFSLFCALLCVPALTKAGEASGTGSCYTMAEAEAEQAIRIHSELMVIGLNCQAMKTRSGKNLYLQFREFTSDHAGLFSSYEDQLLSYYQRTGDHNPEATLNTLRTALANKISTDAAKMRPDVFCNRYAVRIPKVAHMDEETLRRWASTFHPSHPVSRPICEP